MPGVGEMVEMLWDVATVYGSVWISMVHLDSEEVFILSGVAKTQV